MRVRGHIHARTDTTHNRHLSAVIAVVLFYILIRADLEALNARLNDLNTWFDDLKENTNTRFDDFKEYNRLNQEQFTNLSNKVDALAA